ncbi:MAG: PhnD/SsuA/transferrin family substrate-binding protein [Campylobacteraceae bacterium]|nr:PhnD/SsuA/transferrin family substrate-binding protein [Campylobacteraceae bacterium]
MKRMPFTLFLGILSIFFHMQSFAQTPIRVGVAPHSSARIIYETHQDVKLFLEKKFERPVEIVTAKSFSEFAKRCNEGQSYDAILTSPNLAYLAQHLAKYQPFMTYTKGLETTILSRTPDVLKSANRPLRVAGQDPISFSTLTAQEWLEKSGLKEGKDIVYSYYTSASDSLGTILTSGAFDMVIMSWPNYLKLSEDIKSKVHIFYHSPTAPSRIYLAKEGNGITLLQWEEALDAFALSAQGRAHLEATQLQGFKKLSLDALESMKPIADKSLQRLLDIEP